jgi:hypothetical protein
MAGKLKQVEASFVDEMRRHAQIIETMAKYIDERGYVVIMHDRLHPLSVGFLEGHFNASLRIWGDMVGAKYLPIHYYGNGSFRFILPRTRRLRPIVIALRMMARTSKPSEKYHTGAGFLHLYDNGNEFRFTGQGMDDLRTVCAFLDQESSRMILRARHRPKVQLPE